jgi:hypothetical protein
MGRQNLSSLIANRYTVNRGGLAVVPAALVLTLTLPLERYDVRGVEFPLFQSAITRISGRRAISKDSYNFALKLARATIGPDLACIFLSPDVT